MNQDPDLNLPNDVAIRVQGLSKCYQLYDSPADRLKQMFWGWAGKKYAREFWALKDISFEIKKGEAFAIIGRNGAGKSTLLQIIAGTLTETSGRAVVNGRVGALLELGSGFNPEFTGRENIYLNGTILGFSKAQIDQLYAEIVAFADIGAFIDQPLKTYSSGMIVRVAFAVQAFTRPEILIVDEALSVGDLFFTQKCARLMQELRDAGTTIIFVSHDLGSVRNMCARAAYLKGGRLMECGPTQQVIRDYYLEGGDGASPAKTDDGFLDKASGQKLIIKNEFAEVLSTRVSNEVGHETMSFQIGAKAKFKVIWYAIKNLDNTHVSISLKNKMDQVVFCGGSFNLKVPGATALNGNKYIFEFSVTLNLEAGKYSVILSVGQATFDLPNQATSVIEFCLPEPLNIFWDYETTVSPFYGMVGLPYDLEISPN